MGDSLLAPFSGAATVRDGGLLAAGELLAEVVLLSPPVGIPPSPPIGVPLEGPPEVPGCPDVPLVG